MPVPQGSGVIHRKSARQAVYETVCDWIITGVLEPGEKILDSELGEYFSVSRTPVREALQLLQSQKLVLVMPGRATVVAPLDTQDIEKCYRPLADLEALAAELACDTVRAIENGTAQRTPQDNAKATYAPMLTKELSPIDWTQCERYVIDQVRGLIPWPVATAELGGKRFKIFRVEPTGKTTEKAPGTLVALDKKGLEIACGGGAVVRIAELQAEGGKRMRAADYFRGHPIEI